MTIIRLPPPAPTAPSEQSPPFGFLPLKRRRLRGTVIPQGRHGGSPYPPGFDGLQIDGLALTLDGEELILGPG